MMFLIESVLAICPHLTGAYLSNKCLGIHKMPACESLGVDFHFMTFIIVEIPTRGRQSENTLIDTLQNLLINININIFQNLLIDIDIFLNLLIDIDIFQNLDIDINIFSEWPYQYRYFSE